MVLIGPPRWPPSHARSNHRVLNEYITGAMMSGSLYHCANDMVASSNQKGKLNTRLNAMYRDVLSGGWSTGTRPPALLVRWLQEVICWRKHDYYWLLFDGGGGPPRRVLDGRPFSQMSLLLTVEDETAVLQLGLFLISFASNCYITAPIAGCGTFRLGTWTGCCIVWLVSY